MDTSSGPNRLRAIQHQRDLSTASMAALADISPAAYVAVVNRRALLTNAQAEALAKGLAIDTGDLSDFVEDRPNDSPDQID